ncbi:MAG: hypothetical protein R8K22_04615 [Mariprofundaceae bacterium]
MLSPGYFDVRWSWYRPIMERGELPIKRCSVDVRRLPIRVAGEDASEYIPYGIHPSLASVFTQSMRKLRDYAVRYMIKGEKVSGHKLPQMNPVAREIAMHLRKRYPHFPPMLLHHWCADENGALALFEVMQAMWKQSWKQDQTDVAPWVPAVNVLVLKLMREAICKLPSEHAAQMDHVMMCIAGGFYDWALTKFLKQHVDGSVEVTRIATYEAMTIPATPISFLYRQPDDSLLADDRYVAMAYGLDPDIVPRMRVLREKVGPKHEAGILNLLNQDRMGGHFLKRSWARLSLWDLAEKSGQGIWMQWVLDAKKLDQLLSNPEKLPDSAVKLLEASSDHPLAAWLLKRYKGKDGGTPWVQDDRVLMAFRVFEEDVKVEIARRTFEKRWLDQRESVAGKGRGAEVEKMYQAAYDEGKLAYFQPDTNQSLHSGVRLATKQGCLRVEWSDYLAAMTMLHSSAQLFLEKTFLPDVVSTLTEQEGVFLDQCSASGCLLRGTVESLVSVGTTLRIRLNDWFKDAGDTDDGTHMPAVSMCLALLGEWTFTKFEKKEAGSFTLAFSPAVAIADAGVSRDCGTGRLIAYRDHKLGKRPLGGVRVEPFDSGSGQIAQLLYNNGFALTAHAMGELSISMRHKAKVREFRVDATAAKAVLPEYRLSAEGLELICIRLHSDEDAMMVFVKVGKPPLAGMDVDVYELLDARSGAARRIIDQGLKRWG